MICSASAKLQKLLLYLDGAYAPNTLRAYRADMLEFIAYCNLKRWSSLPASSKHIALFLEHTATLSIKTSTIRRKVGSISAVHRLSNLGDPTKQADVRITMRKIQRKLGTRFDQAYPVTRPVLNRLLEACDTSIAGLRDRALLLVAYDSLRRRSEIVALRIEDIDWSPNDLASILLRKSKTDQLGSGHWIHLGDEASDALKEWLDSAGLRSGFIFRGVTRTGKISHSLEVGQIGRIYKKLAEKSGLDDSTVKRISGHSMRVGGAQDLLLQGASLPQIMVKGGWVKTDTVMRYVDRVRRSPL